MPYQPTMPTHRPLPLHTVTTRIPGPFPLSLHSTPLPHLDVNWSIAGNPTGPTVFICPSMSHSAFVTRPRAERVEAAGKATTAGWWESVVGWGEEYGVDLTRFQVVSASPLGGPFGTSSPLSMDDSRGEAFCASFPVITPLDQARCHHALLQHLHRHPALLPSGYRVSLPLYAIIGSSMGGMAAIHFSTSFPQQSDRVIAVCTTPLTSASTQALRSTQRAAVRMDPLYAGGRYTRPPLQGLRLARMMGTICYRSRVEFDQRFSPLVDEDGKFPVERYLDHVGWAFGGRYDANCYLLLSECMDRMDVGQIDGVCARVSYDEAVERVSKDSEWMVLPVTEDALIPAEESDRWAQRTRRSRRARAPRAHQQPLRTRRLPQVSSSAQQLRLTCALAFPLLTTGDALLPCCATDRVHYSASPLRAEDTGLCCRGSSSLALCVLCDCRRATR